MPNTTPNLGLIKPLVTEQYDIAKVTNENADKIDLLLAPKANPVFTGTQTLPSIVTNGIKFPATQVPSSDPNTLDDYEEGTFTPVVYGLTTAGVGTYTNQTGKYTKIGNIVHVQIIVQWAAHTGSGVLLVTTPFATSLNEETSLFGWGGSNNYPASSYLAFALLNDSRIYPNFRSLTNGSYVSNASITSSGYFYISGTYFTF